MTTLDQALKNWINAGKAQDLDLDEEELETRAQAKLVGEAMALVPTFPLDDTKFDDNAFNSALQEMLFLSPETQEAYEGCMQYIFPQLRRLVDDALQRKGIDTDLLISALKPLAGMQEKEDALRVLKAAQLPDEQLSEEYFWSNTLTYFDHEHPYSACFYEQIAKQLPAGFCAVALLDAANSYWNDEENKEALEKSKLAHPFDNAQGIEKLKGWLNDQTPDSQSYAVSATAALPFLRSPQAQQLFALALVYPAASVQLEAAWASVKSKTPEASAATERLVEATLNYETSDQACAYLHELGLEDKIPAAALEPEFRAKAEMASWLMHPQEYGEAPASLELVDTRELYWPPTQDTRTFYLFAYEYPEDDMEDEGDDEANEAGDDEFDDEDDVPEDYPHYGLVGSTTFSLMGESAGTSVEDMYALHCYWETCMQEQPGFEEYEGFEAGIPQGHKLLKPHNKGFGK